MLNGTSRYLIFIITFRQNNHKVNIHHERICFCHFVNDDKEFGPSSWNEAKTFKTHGSSKVQHIKAGYQVLIRIYGSHSFLL